jgi:elongator complex protein 3
MVKGGVPGKINLEQPAERARVIALLNAVSTQVDDSKSFDNKSLMRILRKYPKPGGTYAKSQLLAAYHQLVSEGELELNPQIEQHLQGRPVRTISGVAPVAVLTEPYPCPGECLFCPVDENAPKSYLDGEPGVLRAIQNDYDPYTQTHARLASLEAIGHPLDKIELLILGGTWSAYPEDYKTWFVKRCLDAMNAQDAPDLSTALHINETAAHRNVGLVIETRPDCVDVAEILSLRAYGVTKVQLGAQSFDDTILSLNKRGHTSADTHQAIRLLRLAGFKVVLHWMPNLYGSSLDADLTDFARMWEDPGLRPDELKIYPTALVANTELYKIWQQGRYQPYSERDLIELLMACKQLIPPYCRLNRLMRDIPAQYIIAGTTKSNLRQIVQQKMADKGVSCQCIRCREIRRHDADLDQLNLDIISYETDGTQEHFLQYVTRENQIAAFLRLSLPAEPRDELFIPEIRDVALIREVHVYGPAQSLGSREDGVQHQGLGTQLIETAAEMSREAGFTEIAVISAVGTRPYYRERGFTAGELYPIRKLKSDV